MSKISVVVPVYNVEKYLEQCIESLINQTLKDIEIILVNDGSTDSSGKICDRYAETDRRIKVYHKHNEGVSLARSFGISKAISDYICFLDSDDYAENCFCEIMYYTITKNNADIAECDYNRFSANFLRRVKLYESAAIKSKEEFLNDVVKGTIIYGSVPVVTWNKIYRTEYIEIFVTDYGENLLEDYLFNIQYYQSVNKYVYIDKALINYRQVEGSLSNSVDKNFYNKLKKVQVRKEQFMTDMAMNDDACMQLSYKWFYQYVRSNLINRIFSEGKLNMELKKYIISIITDDVFIKIIDKYDSSEPEILCLKNHNYDRFISILKKAVLKRKIRIKASQIKKMVARGE